MQITASHQVLFSSYFTGWLFDGPSSEGSNYKDKKPWPQGLPFLVYSTWGVWHVQCECTVTGSLVGCGRECCGVQWAWGEHWWKLSLSIVWPSGLLCNHKLNISFLWPEFCGSWILEWNGWQCCAMTWKNCTLLLDCSPKFEGSRELYQGDTFDLAQRAKEGS